MSTCDSEAAFFGHATATAPGKINIALHVGAPAANGYHELNTLFCAVNCYEQVRAQATDTPGISCEFSAASAPYIHYENIPTDRNNLAVAAAELLAEHYGITQGTHLVITKNVPPAGGMGGGSADAAAALVACAGLWGIHTDRATLAQLSKPLGADVPFAVYGGAALGSGIGQELTTVMTTAATHWVIVPAAGAGLSTPEVYAEFDRIHGYQPGQAEAAPQPVAQELIRAFCSGDAQTLAEYMHNDLQQAAINLYPALAETLEIGLREGALATQVSGSGPTVMMLCADAETASALAFRLNDEYQRPAWPVSAPGAGCSLVTGHH